MNHAGDGTYVSGDLTNDMMLYTEGEAVIRINIYQGGKVREQNLDDNFF